MSSLREKLDKAVEEFDELDKKAAIAAIRAQPEIAADTIQRLMKLCVGLQQRLEEEQRATESLKAALLQYTLVRFVH